MNPETASMDASWPTGPGVRGRARSFFLNLPIGHKLTLLTLATSFVALLLACGVFAVSEHFYFRERLARDLTVAAAMAGANSAASLAAQDTASVEQTLQSLSVDPRIVRACVSGRDRLPVAWYQRADVRGKFVPPPVRKRGAQFAGGGLEVVQEISQGGEVIGSVFVQYELRDFRDRAWHYATTLGALLAGGAVVIFLLARRLQSLISRPLLDLAALAGRVATEKNYAIRVVKQNDDEVGRLVERFNEILAQMQQRDSALQRVRDEMEKRVLERTQELKDQILERQRAEETLREKELFIRRVVDTDPNLIFVKDREGRFILVNQATAEFYGMTVEALTGRLETEINPHTTMVAAFQGDDREVMDTLREKFFAEELLTSQAGKSVWLQTVKRPLVSKDGKAHYVLGVAIDITQRRQSEVFLQSVLHHLPVSVFVKEAKDLSYVKYNRASEELTGFTQAELLGRNDSEFFPQDLAEQFGKADRETLNNGRLLDIEEEILTRASERRVLHTQKIPILAEDGTPLYLLGISEDITERRRAEAELEKAHKDLLETSRLAGMAEVATSVLHNVGNVLNSVNVSATLVGDGVKRSKVTELARVVELLDRHAEDLAAFLTANAQGRNVRNYLRQLSQSLEQERQKILGEVESLGQNIEHIREIVAMQQSYARVSGVAEVMNVADLVEDSLRMNAASLSRHEVTIEREFQVVPPITIEKHKALQILVNLVRNAKHACDDSEGRDKRVKIRIANGDGTIKISVTDNGVGIPPENLTRIFCHGFTTRKEGHGFGLHSGALAARDLGGTLLAHSDGPGCGATFTLQLPVGAEANEGMTKGE